MALTAASVPVPDPGKTFKTTAFGSGQAVWQDEAWEFFDEIGELRYHVEWLSASVSRCRLVAYDVDPLTGDPAAPTESQTVADVVRDIGAGLAGQTQLLARLAVFLSVPGEGFIAMVVRHQDEDGLVDDELIDVEQWVGLSREEITKDSRGRVTLTMPDGAKHEFDPDTDLMFRVWNQHPRKAAEATSPVRAARKPLMEIRNTTAKIDNAARSRAVGNGVMFLPEELSLPQTRMSGEDDPGQRSTATDLQDLLFEVATAANKNPDSMAAFLPIMATVPGEMTDKISHIKFDSDVASTSLTTRDSAIRRLALSLNTSPERLLGLGESNHWSAWAIDEADVKMHIAPIIETICNALTRSVLRPAIERAGGDPSRYMVWYDPTPLTQDPDRKDEALNAFDRGAITAEALRKYSGFDDEDGYDLDTLDGWKALATDRAARDVTLIPMLSPLLSTEVSGIDAAAIPSRSTSGAPAAGDATTPESAPPEPTTAARSVVMLCLHRALELANKRRRSRADHAALDGVPMHAAHKVLGPVGVEQARENLAGCLHEIPDDVVAAAHVDPDRLRSVVQRLASVALVSGADPVVTDQDIQEVRA